MSERDPSLDLDAVREAFAASTDFTVGIEEEFALLDPDTLDLVDRFDELAAAAGEDPVLADSVRGELIGSEIEIRSGRGESFAAAVDLQAERRARLFSLARRHRVALAATGTHPWADYREQRIIDTPHYRRLREQLAWVAQRNNTWSLHVHVGVRDADRAIVVCDRLREHLPLLLAASANSPWLESRLSGLHSARSQLFTRSFPRCGIHDPFSDWATYADFVAMLERTDSIVGSTQIWWSVRPHHAFGTVEVRICDAQTSGAEATALSGLIVATVAQVALDYDERRPVPLRPGREIEENLWRAIRYGMSGRLIDFDRGEEIEARAALERHLDWCEPAREQLGIDPELPQLNGAERTYEVADGETIEPGEAVDPARLYRHYERSVAETARTYSPEAVRP